MNKELDEIFLKYKGKKFAVIEEPLKLLCCGGDLGIGEVLAVTHIHSKNRLYIATKEGWGHKVKCSSFNRCCKEL